jgi:hypothetical protein
VFGSINGLDSAQFVSVFLVFPSAESRRHKELKWIIDIMAQP